jgi:hypothetical protein
LGERASRILIEDLRRNGVFLTDPYLTLEKIARGLKDIIGLEATEVIIQRVMIKLDELYNSQMTLEFTRLHAEDQIG